MPNGRNSNDQTPAAPDPRQARHEVQLLLGQIHGVVDRAVLDLDEWFIGESPPTDFDLTAADMRAAYVEVAPHFGTVQAALNTGDYDEALVAVGFGGAQMTPKKKGLWSKITKFVSKKASALGEYLQPLKGVLRWSGTVVGSVQAALEEEIKRVPGAATACEALKEYFEVLENAAESSEEAATRMGAK